ncbi:MAG: 3'-5' exonuclease, partial [Oscillospiraceae bacterium]
ADYEEALSKEGIGSSSSSGSSLLETEEVSLCLSLLRIVDNPLRDADAATVMLSPLFGFTPDDLVGLKLKGRGSLVAAAKAGTDSKSREFSKKLSELRILASRMDVGEFLQTAVLDSEYALLICSGMDFETKLSNIRTFQRAAADYSASGGDLSGFVRLCVRAKENGSLLKRSSVKSEGRVAISTIHGAKGLEWPIVICTDMDKRFRTDELNDPVLFDRNLGIGVKVRRNGEDGYPVMHRTGRYLSIQSKMRSDLLSEEMRIRYVALTRARDRLVVFTKFSMKKKEEKLTRASLMKRYGLLAEMENGAGLWLMAGAASGTAGPDVKIDFVSAEARGEPEEPSQGWKLSEEDERTAGELRERSSFRYPYTPLTAIPAKRSVSSIAEGRSMLSRPAMASGSGHTGSERGTAVHLFMQCADLEAARKDFEAEKMRLVKREYMTSGQAAMVDRDAVEKFLDSDLAREMAENKCYREYPFMFRMKAGEIDDRLKGEFAEAEVLVHGISDCVIESKDGITILDYKTDVVSDADQLRDRYSKQLHLYREAIGLRFKKPVKRCVLWSFALGKAVEIP